MSYETFEVGKFSVRIATDPEPSDPRDDDNLGTMICWHNRYILGDRKRGERMPFDTPSDFQEWADSKESDVAHHDLLWRIYRRNSKTPSYAVPERIEVAA